MGEGGEIGKRGDWGRGGDEERMMGSLWGSGGGRGRLRGWGVDALRGMLLDTLGSAC